MLLVTGQGLAGRGGCNGDHQSLDALDVVSGGCGAEGHANKVRTVISAWTVVEGGCWTPPPFRQCGHGEDILRGFALLQSAVVTIGGDHNCHGQVVLSGSLFVTLLGRGDGGGTMRSPWWSRGLEIQSTNCL